MFQTSLSKPIANLQTVLKLLETSPQAYELFLALPQNKRQEFLDFCCGKAGLYLCYDIFFKEIFNPFIHPKRLEQLISAILGQNIQIIEIIPNEGFHMSDRGSFVLVDMVVRLADNTILNVEIQKSGYRFPGKRFDCYCADLIMREYNRLRERDKEKFSYNNMPPVLSIALMESSTKNFYQFPHHYIHRFQMTSDTGIEVESLPVHIYISLDIFSMFMQNKPIETPLEAWLMLLTTRDLGRIQELIQIDPEFSDIYQEIFELRTRPEELIYMFSKVLLEGDRNMERFMIDEWRKELETVKQEYQTVKQECQTAKQECQTAKQECQTAKQECQTLKTSLAEKDSIIAELQSKLVEANNKK